MNIPDLTRLTTKQLKVVAAKLLGQDAGAEKEKFKQEAELAEERQRLEDIDYLTGLKEWKSLEKEFEIAQGKNDVEIMQPNPAFPQPLERLAGRKSGLNHLNELKQRIVLLKETNNDRPS